MTGDNEMEYGVYERAHQFASGERKHLTLQQKKSIVIELLDDIDGLKSEISCLIDVAYNAGATEYIKINFPKEYNRIRDSEKLGDNNPPSPDDVRGIMK